MRKNYYAVCCTHTPDISASCGYVNLSSVLMHILSSMTNRPRPLPYAPIFVPRHMVLTALLS